MLFRILRLYKATNNILVIITMKVRDLIEAFWQEYMALEEFGLNIIGLYQEFDTHEGEELTIGVGQELEPEDDFIPEQCHLSVMHPFLFDNRKVPKIFMGVRVMNVVQYSTFPPEIEEIEYDPAGFEVHETPDKYCRYVENNSSLIRDALHDNDMTFDDMLDAICWGDFHKYEEEFQEKRLKKLLS